MGGMMPWITAKSIRGTLASWAINPFSLFCLTNLLGFCLNITHIALKAWIFRYYPQTELTRHRSDFDVHGALLDDKVQNKMSYLAV